MKKTLLVPIVTGCMLMLGTVAFAQAPAAQAAPQTQGAPQKAGRPRMTDDERVAKEVAKLDATVHLTPDQQTQVKQLFTKLLAQREQNKTAANGDMEKMRELNKGLGKQRNEELKTILTKDQMASLKAAGAERREERMENSQPAPNK